MAAEADRDIDGVTPAIVEPIAMQAARSRQTEPRVNLFTADPTMMNGLARSHGRDGPVTLGALGPHQLYLNQESADKLDVKPGDTVAVLAATCGAVHGQGHRELERRARLGRRLRSRRSRPASGCFTEVGRIEHILISNRGGETRARAQDQVVKF